MVLLLQFDLEFEVNVSGGNEGAMAVVGGEHDRVLWGLDCASVVTDGWLKTRIILSQCASCTAKANTSVGLGMLAKCAVHSGIHQVNL